MLSKKFEKFIQVLILISVTVSTIETLPSLREYETTFSKVELLLSSVFLIEYILRIYQAERKIAFIFSFFGIIDLLAFAPTFLVFLPIDLRGLRALRLFRVARILKLARYNTAFQRLNSAIQSIRMEIIVFASFSIALVYISSVGIYYFESEAQPEHFKSIPHCFWWSIVTLTTVGYGDVYPITAGGKIFTSFLLILSLGIISVPSALLASALSSNKEDLYEKNNNSEK